MPRQRRNWEHEALIYLAGKGVRDLKRGLGSYTTDVPGHRQGVLYKLETAGLVASYGYGVQGRKWTITEKGLLHMMGHPDAC